MLILPSFSFFFFCLIICLPTAQQAVSFTSTTLALVEGDILHPRCIKLSWDLNKNTYSLHQNHKATTPLHSQTDSESATPCCLGDVP